MGEINYSSTKSLSNQPAKDDLFADLDRQLDEINRSSGIYLKLGNGQKSTVWIDVRQDCEEVNRNPKLVKTQSFDKKGEIWRYRIEVIDLNDKTHKIFMCSRRAFGQLKALLREGYRTIEITRQGEGKETTYSFIPKRQ